MNRLRLKDFMDSRGPAAVGLCATDILGCSKMVNAAQERLMNAREAGDTGWFGSYVQMAFNVIQTDPHLVLPREVSRIINLSVCKTPVFIQNGFYELLAFGVGPQNEDPDIAKCKGPQAFERGWFPTWTDISGTVSKIRVYVSNDSDQGLKTVISGLDQYGNQIYSQTSTGNISGMQLSLQPLGFFVDTPFIMSKVTGIQKDKTVGPVSYYEVDTVTGTQRLLVTMQPGETSASYRRMFVNGVPTNCSCGVPVATTPQTIQLLGMAKLDLIPVIDPSDYLLIQSLEAIIAECQSVRMSTVETGDAKAQAAERHREAVRQLQGQLVSIEGKTSPAVVFAPFGSAHLCRQRIGSMM